MIYLRVALGSLCLLFAMFGLAPATPEPKFNCDSKAGSCANACKYFPDQKLSLIYIGTGTYPSCISAKSGTCPPDGSTVCPTQLWTGNYCDPPKEFDPDDYIGGGAEMRPKCKL